MNEELKQINLKLDKLFKMLENSCIQTAKKPIIEDLLEELSGEGAGSPTANPIETSPGNINKTDNPQQGQPAAVPHTGPNMAESPAFKLLARAFACYIIENPDNDKIIENFKDRLNKIDKIIENFEILQKEINGMAYDIRTIRSRIRRDFA